MWAPDPSRALAEARLAEVEALETALALASARVTQRAEGAALASRIARARTEAFALHKYFRRAG